MSFEKEWQLAIKKVNKINDEVIRDSATDLAERIVDKTPVGNPSQWERTKAPSTYRPGKLKANWQASVGSKKTDRKNDSRDTTGQQTKISIKSALVSLKRALRLT